MSKHLVSLFVNEELLAKIALIAEVNESSVAAEMERAHERYLNDEWRAHHDEFATWSERVRAQRRELTMWNAPRLRGDTTGIPRPETPDLRDIVHRSLAGCQLLTVNITDEQSVKFAFLGGYYGLTIGALAENAYLAHVQAEMLDNPVGFTERHKETIRRRRVAVEKLFTNSLRIS